ncbi:hypothetical protein [Streptomyces sp. B8F3]|uniref:hypothetical protein n=1 Tax=unclassified Streptomyces TaxID=2593676 RepID=UPI00325F5594
MLVTLTGILEAAGAVGVLVPATVPLAAGCLIALMVVMFPANVSAARRHTAQGDPIGRRTVLQVVFIAAAALIIL